jgi:hypothetical protein
MYGIEGAGKTTFGASAPNSVFIAAERRNDRIHGSIVMPAETWDDVEANIKELTNDPHNYKTAVIDTTDWLEKICHAKIMGTGTSKGKAINTVNGGYGAGYREAERLHRELIESLKVLREKRGMNIILLSHYEVKAVKDPDAIADYDAYQIKGHDFVTSQWREWAEAIIFVRFGISMVVKENSTVRPQGDDKRVAFTCKRPAFQAKNSFGLPFEMPFTQGQFWNDLVPYFNTGVQPENLEAVKADLLELYSKVKDEAERAKIYAHMEKIGSDLPGLIKVRNALRTITKGAA